MAEVDARQLKEAIETQHGGTATLAQSIPVLETFEEQPDRDGGSGAMSNVARHTTMPHYVPDVGRLFAGVARLASEEPKQKAMKDYMGCLEAAAAKMDDGKSDAMTVAMAIKPLCAGEFAQSVKLSGSGLSPYARNLFEEKVQANQLELATTAVLDHRRGAKPN